MKLNAERTVTVAALVGLGLLAFQRNNLLQACRKDKEVFRKRLRGYGANV